MKISNLCNEVLTYILSIAKTVGNKDKEYSPTSYLINGATLKTLSKKVKHCPQKNGDNGPPGGRHAGSPTKMTYESTVTHTIKSNESIPSSYTKAITETRIKSDWETFKTTYVTKLLKTNDMVKLNSIVILLYLVRCFVDARFKLFTDTYHKTTVWLYDTSTPSNLDTYYQVNKNLAADSELESLKTIFEVFIDEITDRRSLYVLKSKIEQTISQVRTV